MSRVREGHITGASLTGGHWGVFLSLCSTGPLCHKNMVNMERNRKTVLKGDPGFWAIMGF